MYVTGRESCPMLKIKQCYFEVKHYFREPSQYAVVIIIKNQVSKVFTKIGINVYDGMYQDITFSFSYSVLHDYLKKSIPFLVTNF